MKDSDDLHMAFLMSFIFVIVIGVVIGVYTNGAPRIDVGLLLLMQALLYYLLVKEIRNK